MDNFDIRKWRSQMLIEAAERAEKDYDGDGKIESPEEEYLGSKDKAIKASMKNEAPEYYGVDRDTEMRAAGIGGSTNSMPWKNATRFVAAVKSYIKPADIQSLSTSRVITKPGSKTYMTFIAKDGFDMGQVVETLTPGLERMSKVGGLHFLIQEIDANSFSLSAKRPYDTFTDDLGKELNIDKSSEYYIGESVTEGAMSKFTDYSNNELAAYARELLKQRADAASKGQSDLLGGISKEIEAATRELKKRSQKLKGLSRTDVEEDMSLLRGASKETRARDTEESDREYIKTRQERNKIAQQLYKKDYKDLDLHQKSRVNSKRNTTESVNESTADQLAEGTCSCGCGGCSEA